MTSYGVVYHLYGRGQACALSYRGAEGATRMMRPRRTGLRMLKAHDFVAHHRQHRLVSNTDVQCPMIVEKAAPGVLTED